MLTIFPEKVSTQVLQQYLQGSIAPRPVAFASTVDAQGNVNLSPFSFFNVFGTNPPTLVFSPSRRGRDGSTKDTLENVLEVAEVVINIVDYSMVEQMSLASCEYEKGVNEFVKAGFTEVKSLKVTPPRVGESKACFECKVQQVIEMGKEGGAANLVICEVLVAHFSPDILNEAGMIDQQKTDWIARLGGDWYLRASGDCLFEVPKPNRNQGVGVDAIPEFIRTNPAFSGNELGRLGNIEKIPDQETITNYLTSENPVLHVDTIKNLLAEKKVAAAWMVLLSLNQKK
ncbi:MAG: flavin reductase family protein [Verrucomicrobia bacterium]|nr:flavin reductase family protein [Cytophagales bacterium]